MGGVGEGPSAFRSWPRAQAVPLSYDIAYQPRRSNRAFSEAGASPTV